jgi:hypothetical protein
VPVCVPDAAIICSQTKKAIGWDHPIFVVRSIAPLRIFTDEHSYESCWLLHRKLSTRIANAVDDNGYYKQKGGRGGNYKLPHVRNGPVTTCVRLACALRFFAGASLYDIMAKYGISKKSVSESVWAVVEAVNNLDDLTTCQSRSKTINCICNSNI